MVDGGVPRHGALSAAAAYALVAAGSAAGAVARVVPGSLADGSGPASVLAANLLGCLVFGFAGPVFARSPRLARWWPAVGPGFLGGFTTFSAFLVLLDGLSPVPAAVFAAVTLIGCPVAAWLGRVAAERSSASSAARGRAGDGTPPGNGGPR